MLDVGVCCTFSVNECISKILLLVGHWFSLKIWETALLLRQLAGTGEGLQADEAGTA